VRLGRATLWNLAGLGAPVLLALLCFPVLLQELGRERFGLLSLLWALLGSAALFDLGLARALTVMVSQRIGSGDTVDIRDRVHAGLIVLGAVGLFFALVMLAASGKLATLVKASDVSIAELHRTLLIASAALVLVVTSSALSCSLEAFQRFDFSNALRILVGVGTVGGTTLASFATVSLPVLASVLVLSRLITVAVGSLALRHLLRSFPEGRGVLPRHLKEFVGFSRWITAGNLLSPVLAFGDRLALSVLIPANSLAYYLVPYDIVSRVLIFPGAVVSSLFPMLSGQSDHQKLRALMRQATLSIAAVMAPLLTALAVQAHFGLSIWMSSDFAESSALIAQILCVGALFNSLARTPFVLLQSRGCAKQVVLVQLWEVPIFIAALYLAGNAWSVLGVAVAWSGRMALDAVLLWLLAANRFGLRREAHLQEQARTKLIEVLDSASSTPALVGAATSQGSAAKFKHGAQEHR
jgi:O-antigen/teichoic acid export membrane protein